MAFDQQKWNESACGCRCLIEFARRRGETITTQELYDKYASEYTAWETKPGSIDNLLLSRIISDYKLAKSVAIFCDADRIFQEINTKEFIGLFGFTERMPREDGQSGLAITHHVLLLTPEQGGHIIQAWNPLKNGQAEESPLMWGDWSNWMMRGMVLYSA